MIQEYALEPALLSSWQNLCQFTAPFTFEQGRLISEFPKLRKWKRMARAACETVKPIEKKKIEESLLNIDFRFIRIGRDREDVRGYDGNLTWYANAVAEDGRRRFHAIIARDNPDGHATVICVEDWDNEHTLLKSERGKVIPRNGASYRGCLEQLLKASDEIIFVDPYYDPSQNKFINSFRHILGCVYAYPVSPNRVEIHTEAKPLRDRVGMVQRDGAGNILYESFNDWKQKCERYLKPMIPQYEKISVTRWRSLTGGERLHPRYVMIDKGGIRFDYGLDEGRPGEQTDVEIMSDSLHQQRWRAYLNDGKGPYDFYDVFTVVGV